MIRTIFLVAYFCCAVSSNTIDNGICGWCKCKTIFGPNPTREVHCSTVEGFRQGAWFENNYEQYLYLTDVKLSSLPPINSSVERVTKLVFSNNHIEELEKNFFEDFPNLQNASLSGNDIKHIRFSTFRSSWKLKQIDLSNNLIILVEFDWFASCLLESLSLKNNKIEILQPPDTPLAYLEELDLSYNVLSNVSMNGSLFPGLKKLGLSHNAISLVSPSFLNELPKLIHLDLSNNKIVHLSLKFSQAQLSSVLLHENNLEDVEFSVHMTISEIMNLSRNQLTSLELPFQSAKIINVSSNKLKSLEFLKNQHRVEIFDGSHNLVESLKSIPQGLHFMNLSSNRIGFIEPRLKSSLNLLNLSLNLDYEETLPETFSYMFQNEGGYGELDLSSCSIKKLSADTFKGARLSKLTLARNQIEALPENLVSWENVTVDIQMNPINCSCSSQWLLDTYVSTLTGYGQSTDYLSELRCAAPPSVAGERLSRLHLSNVNFCLADNSTNDGLFLSDSSADNEPVTLRTSKEMLIVLASLGLLLVLMVWTGVFLQRRIDNRKAYKNRRFW